MLSDWAHLGRTAQPSSREDPPKSSSTMSGKGHTQFSLLAYNIRIIRNDVLLTSVVHLFSYRSGAPSFRTSRIFDHDIPISHEKQPDVPSHEIQVG